MGNRAAVCSAWNPRSEVMGDQLLRDGAEQCSSENGLTVIAVRLLRFSTRFNDIGLGCHGVTGTKPRLANQVSVPVSLELTSVKRYRRTLVRRPQAITQ